MASPTQYYRKQLFERSIHYTFKTFNEFRLAKLDYIFNSFGNTLHTYKDFKNYIKDSDKFSNDALCDEMFNRPVYRSRTELCNYYLDSPDENTECFLIRPAQLTYYPNMSVESWISKISLKACGSWFVEQWVPEIIFLYQTILHDLEHNPSRFRNAYIGHDIEQATEMINHLRSTARPWSNKDIFAMYGVEYTSNIFEFLSRIWEKKKEKYRLRCNRAIDHLSQFI